MLILKMHTILFEKSINLKKKTLEFFVRLEVLGKNEMKVSVELLKCANFCDHIKPFLKKKHC